MEQHEFIEEPLLFDNFSTPFSADTTEQPKQVPIHLRYKQDLANREARLTALRTKIESERQQKVEAELALIEANSVHKPGLKLNTSQFLQ